MSKNVVLDKYFMINVLMYYELSNGQEPYSKKKTEDANLCLQ